MKKLTTLVLAAMLCAAPASTQNLKNDVTAQIDAYLAKAPEASMQVVQSPDDPVLIPDEARKDVRYSFQKRMAVHGHGVLFDVDGYRVTLDENEALALQAELLKAARLEEISQEVPKGAIPKLNALIKEMDAAAAKEGAQADAARQHLTLRAMAYRFDPARREQYLWRADYLWNAVLRRRFDFRGELTHISDRLREIIESLFRQTGYMAACEAGGVPVPPNFSMTTGDWTHQGDLTTNMLSPGNRAQVWTWASPAIRGACVALPRGTGDADDVAGIICQGAETGNACFWDNIDRATGNIIPWAGATLRINAIQDGTELSGCPTCHKGNNVYLVAPDDPTWCRLLRGRRPAAGCAPPGGADADNLTLQISGVVDPLPQPGTSVVHSRFRFLSGSPPRPGWTNTAVTNAGCGGSCHLNSVGSFTVPRMPPACGTDCN